MSTVGARIPLALWGLVAGGLGGLAIALAAAQLSPVKAVFLVLGLVVATLSMLFPPLALGLTVLVIPIERMGRFTSDSSMYTFSLMRAVGLLALAVLLVHVLVRKKALVFGRPFFIYLAYCGMATLSIFYTSDFLGTVRAVSAVLANLMFFFLVANMARTWNLAQMSIALWLFSSVMAGLYTIYDWHLGQGFVESAIGDTTERFSTVLKDTSEWETLEKHQIARASGTTSHPAVYGINLVMTLPFFAYFLRAGLSRAWTGLVALGLLVVLYNILLTNTRAVLLMVPLVLGLCAFRGLVKVTAGRIMMLVVAGALMLPFVPSDVYDRILNPSNYSYRNSGTLRIRLEYWRAGLELIQDNFLLGVGLANQQVIPRYIKGFSPKETSVHNEYLETFIELGIVGWLLFFGFVASVLWTAVRAGRRFRAHPDTQPQYRFMLAIQIAMIVTLVFGVQVDVFHFPLKGWWLLAGLSWAMLCLASARDKREAVGEPPALNPTPAYLHRE